MGGACVGCYSVQKIRSEVICKNIIKFDRGMALFIHCQGPERKFVANAAKTADYPVCKARNI